MKPFSIGNLHNSPLNHVKSDFVNLTLKSNPINLILYPGEEKKINTTSDYYDFYIKLNSINHGLANITIKEIHEEIKIASAISSFENVSSESEVLIVSNVAETILETPKITSMDNLLIKIFGIIVVLVIIALVIIKLAIEKDKNVKSFKKKR